MQMLQLINQISIGVHVLVQLINQHQWIGCRDVTESLLLLQCTIEHLYSW